LNHAFWARFNAGRFQVTTEAKLRPLARFGCSMVWRLISAFRANTVQWKMGKMVLTSSGFGS
jgi:hypothetical protein